MALTLKDSDPGERFSANHVDAAGQPTGATVVWTVDNAAVIKLTDHGDGTADAVPAGVGNAALTATATDADGNHVASAPFGIVVVAGDTTAVNVVDGGPIVAPGGAPTPAPAPTPA